MKTLLVVWLLIPIAGLCLDAGVQAAPDATTLSMRGTLAGYDATTRTVSMTTRSGTVSLTLVAATRIRQGRHEIDSAALERLTGYRACCATRNLLAAGCCNRFMSRRRPKRRRHERRLPERRYPSFRCGPLRTVGGAGARRHSAWPFGGRAPQSRHSGQPAVP